MVVEIVFENEEIKEKRTCVFHKECNINILKVVVAILHICSIVERYTAFSFANACF